MEFTERSIINGSLLRSFTAKPVSILVNIDGVNGKLLKGKTTDNHEISVNLPEPPTSLIQNWVEVIGTPISATTVKCTEIIPIETKDDVEPFDTDAHNMLVVFLNNCSDFYRSN